MVNKSSNHSFIREVIYADIMEVFDYFSQNCNILKTSKSTARREHVLDVYMYTENCQ